MVIELSNGIPVILQNYDGPVAATYWWVRTGSSDEAPKEAGFAHFLEHMLFKDAAAKETGKASTGQMARAIESLGGDINAYTSFDQTVYHVTCAAEHWEKVLDAFGTMAKPQKFLKTDFEREREVILEELRKNEDSPERQLFQSLFGETYSKHPYGRPVIGFVKTLKAAKVGELEAFYKRQYVSGNMGLILVGPIQDEKGERKKEILRLLEKRFGSLVIKKRETERRARPEERALNSAPSFTKRGFQVKSPTLAISFRVPELRHADTPALDLISSILGMGELSRLYQRIFYKKSLVTDVSAGLYVPNDPGMFYVQCEVAQMEQVGPATTEVLKELVRLRDEGPTDEELARVMVHAESERMYSTQTADGQAGRLGFLKFVVDDMSFDDHYLSELRAVDAQKIKEVARKYFDPKRMSGVFLLPKEKLNELDLRPLAKEAEKILGKGESKAEASARSKTATRAKAGSVLSRGEVIQLPSGMRVAYFHRPQSHLISVHAAALGGLRLELADPVESAEADWGSSYMMSLTWAKGTSKKTSQQIAAEIEGRAAGMDGFSGRNTIGLHLNGLARDWTALSETFAEVLLDPSFPADEVEHSRRVAEESVRGIEDHSSQLCSKLFLETLFEAHPYGRLTIGSLESLPQISSEKLREFHRRWIRPERMVLTVVGALKRNDLDRWVTEMDQRVREIQPGRNTLKGGLPDEILPGGPRWAEKKLGREQLHIMSGSLGTRINAEDREALRLLQTLLGGQSGRLFIELREKKSLAYTVSPIGFEGIERGYVGTYIACSPQKKDEALEGIRRVYESLAKKGLTAAEMSRAKEFLLGRRAMDLQSDASIASHAGLEILYGLDPRNEPEYIRRIREMTAKDLQKVCQKYLVEPPMVTSIVG